MWEDIAILKGNPTATYDTYGNEKLTYTDTQIFVQSRSVYQQEFYNAAQLGIHPSIVLKLTNRADYNGEKLVEYQGTLYDIVRADWKNGRDALELTLAERIGLAQDREDPPAPEPEPEPEEVE